MNQLRILSVITALTFLCLPDIKAQSCDCAYPMIFLHGYTGNQDTFDGTIADGDFQNIWGARSDVFHAVLNAQESTNIWGDDGVEGTDDDDVLVSFDNETNTLAPGCIYSINFENYWNENESNPEILLNTCSSPTFFASNSNESSIMKQGYALSQMIAKVLAANPDKSKVIVVGHSMGGLEIREYLQRTEGGNPRWWVGSGAEGHQVKKAITTVTPHRGSNLLGNPWPFNPKNDNSTTRNGIPDITSEAVRDLRWNYAFDPLSPFYCGFFGSCPGPYLFGGDEDMPWGYANHDINCDGDETDPVIVGINETGASDPWDGTRDNPAMPLPTNIRYTWITSDVGTSGDLVVDLDRQWIYTGSTPVPSDGTAYRLTDTLLTDQQHLSVDDDVEAVVRGLDESDYPQWAYEVSLDHSAPYAGIAQIRSASVPEGSKTTDPDWYVFTAPATTDDDLCLVFDPVTTLSGRIDFFDENPGAYTPMSTAGSYNQSFGTGSGQFSLLIPAGSYTASGQCYIRITHNAVERNSWKSPYKILPITKAPLPINLLSFDAEKEKDQVRIQWTTDNEFQNDHFEVLRSNDGRRFDLLAKVVSKKVNGTSAYQTIDPKPFTGKNFYKLKQVDINGSFSYSPMRQVIFEGLDPSTITIFPNPSRDKVLIQKSNFGEGTSYVEALNALGQIILRKPMADETLILDVSDWPVGLYGIRVRQASRSFTKQLQIIR